jgi:hypothetical protein
VDLLLYLKPAVTVGLNLKTTRVNAPKHGWPEFEDKARERA